MVTDNNGIVVIAVAVNMTAETCGIVRLTEKISDICAKKTIRLSKL